MKRLIWFCVVLLVCSVTLGGVWDAKRTKAAFAFAEAEEADGGNVPAPAGEDCPDCYGTGQRGDGRFVVKCPTCNGTGKRKNGSASPAVQIEGTKIASGGVYGLKFTAGYCGPCKVWDREEAPDVELKFEPIDIETDEGKAQAEAAGVARIPAFLICDSDLGTVLSKTVGAVSAEVMNETIRLAKAEKETRRKRNEPLAILAAVRICVVKKDGETYGSGTIVKSEGGWTWVLTAAHVLGSGKILVHPANAVPGDEYAAEIVELDEITDLAIVRFKSSTTFKALGDVGNLISGEAVLSGYPEGGDFRQEPKTIRKSMKMDDITVGVTVGVTATGYSGGALTVEGTIVGVASATNRKEEFTVYASGDSIRALKKKAFDKPIRTGGASIRERLRADYPPGTMLAYGMNRGASVLSHLLNDHGYSMERLQGLTYEELLKIHDAAHRGVRY